MHSTPSTRPMPVTMPAAGTTSSYSSYPASGESSRNGEPGSSRRSTRSRTSIFPRSVCRTRARSSPPRRTSASRSRSSAASSARPGACPVRSSAVSVIAIDLLKRAERVDIRPHERRPRRPDLLPHPRARHAGVHERRRGGRPGRARPRRRGRRHLRRDRHRERPRWASVRRRARGRADRVRRRDAQARPRRRRAPARAGREPGDDGGRPRRGQRGRPHAQAPPRLGHDHRQVLSAPPRAVGSAAVPAAAAAALPDPETELSADEARRIALRAQGLIGAPDRRGGVPAMLRALGAVQLDTISVLARSHELVAYARLGPVRRAKVEHAYWGGDAFEYWSHAASILPQTEWPWFAFRRRRMRARQKRWHDVHRDAVDAVRAQLRDAGPLTTKDLGGAKASAEWWDWSEAKIAVEWLLDVGEVVCVERRGWRRVYDLPERVLPPDLLAREPSDTGGLPPPLAQARRALGVAARTDLADYYRLKVEQVDAVIEETGLVPVAVEGWRAPAWADPGALERHVRGRHRTTLLSPFDSLVWDR